MLKNNYEYSSGKTELQILKEKTEALNTEIKELKESYKTNINLQQDNIANLEKRVLKLSYDYYENSCGEVESLQNKVEKLQGNNNLSKQFELDYNELIQLRKENEDLRCKNKSIIELSQCLIESINRVTIFDKDKDK